MLSDLAKKLGKHVPNVSRELVELEEIVPKILRFDQQPRPEGGRSYKLCTLTNEQAVDGLNSAIHWTTERS